MRAHITCVVGVALSLWNVIVVSSSYCNDYSSSGCEKRVKKSSWFPGCPCRWCELDNQCHALGSIAPFNPCTKDQVIKSQSNCPKVNPEINVYSPEIAYDQVRLAAIPYSDTQDVAYKCVDNFLSDSDFQIYAFVGTQKCEYILPDNFYDECLASVSVSRKKRAIVVVYRGSTSGGQVLDQILSTIAPKCITEIKTCCQQIRIMLYAGKNLTTMTAAAISPSQVISMITKIIST